MLSHGLTRALLKAFGHVCRLETFGGQSEVGFSWPLCTRVH